MASVRLGSQNRMVKPDSGNSCAVVVVVVVVVVVYLLTHNLQVYSLGVHLGLRVSK